MTWECGLHSWLWDVYRGWHSCVCWARNVHWKPVSISMHFSVFIHWVVGLLFGLAWFGWYRYIYGLVQLFGCGFLGTKSMRKSDEGPTRGMSNQLKEFNNLFGIVPVVCLGQFSGRNWTVYFRAHRVCYDIVNSCESSQFAVSMQSKWSPNSWMAECNEKFWFGSWTQSLDKIFSSQFQTNLILRYQSFCLILQASM